MRYKSIAAAIVAGVALSASAGVTITNVKATPRWPWNGKVDIDYTLTTDKEDETFYVYPVGMDGDRKLSITPITLEGDGAKGQKVGAGTHRMTWDATADDPTFNSSSFTMKIYAFSDAAPYMVVNMSGGTSVDKFETSYLPDVPEGGWTDEYKTTKLVLKLILPGSFLMGSPDNETMRSAPSGYDSCWQYVGNESLHRVSLTKPFYVGVFELSEAQWDLVAGGATTDYSVIAKRGISYDAIRGSKIGCGWPQNSQVDADSFLGVLRAKSGMAFDLPTEAQWEYVAKAGRTGRYGVPDWNDDSLSDYVSFDRYNSPYECGKFKPNCWGIYNTIGNVAEWCLDWYVYDLGSLDATDPRGGETALRYDQKFRIIKDSDCRIQSNYVTKSFMRNASRKVGNASNSSPSSGWYSGGRAYWMEYVGARLVRNLAE